MLDVHRLYATRSVVEETQQQSSRLNTSCQVLQAMFSRTDKPVASSAVLLSDSHAQLATPPQERIAALCTLLWDLG